MVQRLWCSGGAVTSFNLVLRFADLSLGGFVGAIRSYYESLVHEPVGILLQYVGLRFTHDWIVDALVLWMLTGGVVARSASVLRASYTSHDYMVNETQRQWREPWENWLEDVWIFLVARRGVIALSCFWFTAIFFWPIYGVMLWRDRYLYKFGEGNRAFQNLQLEQVGGDQEASGTRITAVNDVVTSVETLPANTSIEIRFKSDMRVVLVTQALSLLLCTIAFLAWGAISGLAQ